jgi:IMP cyclohydrolase
MYVGRIVAIGQSGGKSWVGYRVSSRAFPNRKASLRGDRILVSPLDPGDMVKNPYIAYDCIRVEEDVAVVANGTQADMIFEKIVDGMKPMDAIALSLIAYGYERDELDTPRIAGVVSGSDGWLGIAQKDEVRTKRFSLGGSAYMVATYEKTEFESIDIGAEDAYGIARAMFDLSFERPVCSAAAFQDDSGFELAVNNPE